MKKCRYVGRCGQDSQAVDNESWKTLMYCIFYQSKRVYGDEIPKPNWKVINGGLKTFYFKY